MIAKPAAGVRGERYPRRRIDGRPAGPEHSFPDYQDYAAQTTTLAPLLACCQFQRFVLSVDGGSYAVSGGLVSGNYFDTLGVRLRRGRTFSSADDAAPNRRIVSERVVQSHFEVSSVIGRTVLLNGHAHHRRRGAPDSAVHGWAKRRRLGVAQAYHRLQGTTARLIVSDHRFKSSAAWRRRSRFLPERAEFATISARLQVQYAATNRNSSVALLRYSMTSGGNSIVAEQAPRFLAIFSIVTALTLAIVCANVANLMLGRAVLRQRELALRQTLGASRARILGTLLTEGFIVSIAAWLAACVFRWRCRRRDSSVSARH